MLSRLLDHRRKNISEYAGSQPSFSISLGIDLELVIKAIPGT